MHFFMVKNKKIIDLKLLNKWLELNIYGSGKIKILKIKLNIQIKLQIIKPVLIIRFRFCRFKMKIGFNRFYKTGFKP